MSLIKIHKCDVCNKEMDKFNLYRFKRKCLEYDEWYSKDEIINFDICKKCYRKIVKQISKESV
jgi:hypothetical protein